MGLHIEKRIPNVLTNSVIEVAAPLNPLKLHDLCDDGVMPHVSQAG